ncbi:hypothetical protein LNL84_11405 [Vibrio sp. ZSDZ34]|jgi:hypothetical protein|uniref:Uncharacterized protein n=1 Tax=Vibrio gelatinilyticus TaxID=2893468 RepID=A0A9X1WAR6_9VIBR|nr:hypothetical protein [Vibrio gelatinilyticus]MCJ2377437.1 hypothetical protein [Vibrio gelatinilyticus]
MNKLLLATTLLVSSFSTVAADQQCFSDKYEAYVDASVQWYQDLVVLTSKQYPNLEEVGNWFLDGRKNHFELNRQAVNYYLENDPTKIATERSVESWLMLEQADIRALAQRDDELGKAAQATYQDRQSTPHTQNYDLRSAFADLLSHPKKIDAALNKYNSSIKLVEKMDCQ